MSQPCAKLAADGRDPQYVPENWTELLDTDEWQLSARGLPSRQAARVLVLRNHPEPAALLVVGHDFGDENHRWIFTPGGGILPGEDPRAGAARELQEETGIELSPQALLGPVIERDAIFHFNSVTCQQHESFFLAFQDEHHSTEAAGQEMERAGWTSLEQELLDSVRWWPLTELEHTVAQGHLIFPIELPQIIREFLPGWDGDVRQIFEGL